MEDDDGHWRTRAVEDFVRTVYELQQTANPVSTRLISRSLHVTAPSVNDMIRRLGAKLSDSEHPHGFYPPTPLLEYQPYHGVYLTLAGEQVALQVIRRRRLLKLYLVKMLGYSWDEVDAEADRLEHAISEHLTERLALVLGNPQTDPQGDPIPNEAGALPICAEDRSLVDIAVGQLGVITRITDCSPDLLHYLGDLGLRPGVALGIVDRSPLGDTFTVQVSAADSSCVLSAFVARHLRLTCEAERVSKHPVPVQLDVKASER